MDSEQIFQQYSKEIDKIKYTDDIKQYPVSEDITIGWERSLPKPPENSSSVTFNELKYLERITKNLNSTEINLVKLVDKEPLDLFTPILRKNGLEPLKKKDWKKLWNTSRPPMMNLKYKFNRPRPDQLGQIYGIKINVTQTKTHHTPAYPSGHTYYTAMAAHLLSARYPRLSGEFFHQVGVAGLARCLQGVHYPSDNDAAMALSGVIWEDLRLKLFPELFIETWET